MRNKNILIVMAIIILLLITGCTPNENKPIVENKDNKAEETKPNIEENSNKSTEKNLYSIDVTFNPEEKILEGIQNVQYTNFENVELKDIYFHIYPNAFRNRETVPFLFDDFVEAYPQGFTEGFIDIKEVKIDDKAVNFNVIGDTQTILEITPEMVVGVGENISIDMKYTIKIPPARERFGYSDQAYNFGNWYPVLAVYDKDGWNLDPYYPIGDPFYTDTSDYKVKITTPNNFTIASTGNVASEINKENIVWNIEAQNVRDFAWVASDNFELIEQDIDGIKVKVYLLKDNYINDNIKKEAMEFAIDSVKVFNKSFGKYPYQQYSVVQTNFPSGMEYPQIVFVGSQYYNNEYIRYLETIIVHETAHQWWYSVVGNDQVDESWLDESLASYSEVVYFTDIYGEVEGEKYHEYENQSRYDMYPKEYKEEPVLKTLNEFEGWDDYSLLVYTKGAVFLDNLKEIYGDNVFYEILSRYYERFQFKIAHTEDLIEISEEVTGDELKPLFDKWLR